MSGDRYCFTSLFPVSVGALSPSESLPRPPTAPSTASMSRLSRAKFYPSNKTPDIVTSPVGYTLVLTSEKRQAYINPDIGMGERI